MRSCVAMASALLLFLSMAMLLVPSLQSWHLKLLGGLSSNGTSPEEIVMLLDQNFVPAAAPPPPQPLWQPPPSSSPSTPPAFPSSPWNPTTPPTSPTASRRKTLLAMAGILTAGRRADEAAAGAQKVRLLMHVSGALQLALLLDASRDLVWPEEQAR